MSSLYKRDRGIIFKYIKYDKKESLDSLQKLKTSIENQKIKRPHDFNGDLPKQSFFRKQLSMKIWEEFMMRKNLLPDEKYILTTKGFILERLVLKQERLKKNERMRNKYRKKQQQKEEFENHLVELCNMLGLDV